MRADRLAKEGTHKKQYFHPISQQEVKTLIKEKYRESWRQRTNSKYPDEPINRLSRRQYTTIFRLKTGHCRFNAHMYRMTTVQSAQSSCQTAPQTPNHILQSCPLQSNLREHTWPEEEYVQGKLWGTFEELLLACQFIEASQIVI